MFFVIPCMNWERVRMRWRTFEYLLDAVFVSEVEFLIHTKVIPLSDIWRAISRGSFSWEKKNRRNEFFCPVKLHWNLRSGDLLNPSPCSPNPCGGESVMSTTILIALSEAPQPTRRSAPLARHHPQPPLSSRNSSASPQHHPWTHTIEWHSSDLGEGDHETRWAQIGFVSQVLNVAKASHY